MLSSIFCTHEQSLSLSNLFEIIEKCNSACNVSLRSCALLLLLCCLALCTEAVVFNCTKTAAAKASIKAVSTALKLLMQGGGGWNNYWPYESTREETKWRIPAHADAELFTLLFQQEGGQFQPDSASRPVCKIVQAADTSLLVSVIYSEGHGSFI